MWEVGEEVSNRKMGHDFEKELCHTLYDNGFWVHNLTQNAAGQPFDLIAVRNGRAYAIDAKVCANDVFLLSRIEENQRYAMSLWMECGNTYPFLRCSYQTAWL